MIVVVFRCEISGSIASLSTLISVYHNSEILTKSTKSCIIRPHEVLKMKKNIKKVSENFITAEVEKKVCPLNWLAEFYKEFPGKLVVIDSTLFSFLLNDSQVDEIGIKEGGEYRQEVSLLWTATDEYPETRVVIDSLGKDKIGIIGEKFVVNGDKNYYIISELQAEDILVDEMKYADNLDDGQVLYLVGEKKHEKIFE